MRISCLKHGYKPTNENKLFKTWIVKLQMKKQFKTWLSHLQMKISCLKYLKMRISCLKHG